MIFSVTVILNPRTHFYYTIKSVVDSAFDDTTPQQYLYQHIVVSRTAAHQVMAGHDSDRCTDLIECGHWSGARIT